MKGFFQKVAVVLIVLIVIGTGIYMALAGDTQNKISRTAVSYLDGDYKVTFAEGSHVRTWTIVNGKVTSEPGKGYYFFWATTNGKKSYIQTPIARTYIEEM